VELVEAHGPGIREHLVTDVVPLAQAPALLADLAARRRHVIQAVFACPAAGRDAGDGQGAVGAAAIGSGAPLAP
jgi:hypothetical protein